MLEAVPRAAAGEPGIGCLWMAIDDEPRVRRVFVLADSGFQERGVLEGREPEPQVVARRPQRLERRSPLTGRRIERGAAGVVAHLDPPPFIARNAVEDALALVDPDRQHLLREAPIARRGAEEEHFLPRRPDAIADDLGKQTPEPGSARENVGVGGERTAFRDSQGTHPAPADRAGCRRARAVFAPFRLERLQDRLAGAAGEKVPGILLVNRPADALEVDLRIARRGLDPSQLLDGETRLTQEGQGRSLVLVVLSRQPQNAGLPEQRTLRALLKLTPHSQRSRHHVDVDPIGPVSGADDPGLSAGTGSRVAGPPGIEQRDPRAAAHQVQRRPAAERAGTHHRDARSCGPPDGAPRARRRRRQPAQGLDRLQARERHAGHDYGSARHFHRTGPSLMRPRIAPPRPK